MRAFVSPLHCRCAGFVIAIALYHCNAQYIAHRLMCACVYGRTDRQVYRVKVVVEFARSSWLIMRGARDCGWLLKNSVCGIILFGCCECGICVGGIFILEQFGKFLIAL